jgi:hypothetical protein
VLVEFVLVEFGLVEFELVELMTQPFKPENIVGGKAMI